VIVTPASEEKGSANKCMTLPGTLAGITARERHTHDFRLGDERLPTMTSDWKIRKWPSQPLSRLRLRGLMSERGYQLLEMRVLAKAFKIVVGQHAIGVFIPAVDGFL
jgi:hypothetical protein